MTLELAYVTALNLQTAVATADSYYQWNMNDLFDPDRTSAGQQWMYRDQVATLYQNYRAIKCSFELIVTGYTTNVGDAIHVAVYPELSGSAHTSYSVQTASCEPMAQYGIVQCGAPTLRMRGSFRPWHLLGLTAKQWEIDNSYLAAIGSSPSATNVLTMVYTSVNTNQPVLVGRMLLRTTFVLYNQLSQTMS